MIERRSTKAVGVRDRLVVGNHDHVAVRERIFEVLAVVIRLDSVRDDQDVGTNAVGLLYGAGCRLHRFHTGLADDDHSVDLAFLQASQRPDACFEICDDHRVGSETLFKLSEQLLSGNCTSRSTGVDVVDAVDHDNLHPVWCFSSELCDQAFECRLMLGLAAVEALAS